MRGFRFVTTLWIFGLCWLSMSCSDKELSFSNVEDNSKVKFSSGTKSGVVVNSSGNLTIDTDSLSGVSLDPSWTPKYDNIVGYWKMDGDWTDSSGNGYDLSIGAGDPSFSSSGVQGSSGAFDGVDDYVSVDVAGGPLKQIDSTTDFTLSFWLSMNSTQVETAYTSNHVLTISNDTGPGEYLARVFYHNQTSSQPGRFDFTRWNGSSGASIFGSDRVKEESFHHIVFVKSGSTVSYYWDGVYRDSVADLATYGAGVTRIDFSGRIASTEITGALDEIAIWNDDLSSAEILNVYQKQRPKFSGELDSSWTPQWESLAGYWKLDGNWFDSSGNGNHGVSETGTSFGSSFKVGSAAFSTSGSVADDEVSIPNNSQLENIQESDFSISLWANPDTSNGTSLNVIFGKQGYNTAIAYRESTNAFTFMLFDATTSYIGCSSNSDYPPNGGFHHLLATFNKATGLASFYINGILVCSRDNTDGVDIYQHGTQMFFIGTAGNQTFWDFGGLVDDVALWGTTLTAAEVSTIYNRQKQKYAGTFTSHVFDFGTNGSWLGLDVITPLPFMKELPGLNGSESSAVYSDLVGSGGSIGDDDLMDGLVGRWTFNEASATPGADNDFLDLSGNSNHGELSGSGDFGQNGIFGKALGFDGSSTLVAVPNDASLNVSEITMSIWAQSGIDNPYRGMLLDKVYLYSSATTGYGMSVEGNGNPSGTESTIRVELGTGVNQLITVSSIDIKAGHWHYYSFTYSRATGSQIYIDGQRVYTDAVDRGSIVGSPHGLNIGRRVSLNYNYWYGNIDEVAIWSRALTSSEILQLYRRGSNRLKYQVRSCAQSDCSDGVWKGPGGDGTTYYSELFNRLSSNFNFSCSSNTSDSDSSVCVEDEISFLGSPLVIAPSLLFRDMAGSATLDRNRYFQFKVLMESDDENNLCSGSPCLPELKSLKVRHGP